MNQQRLLDLAAKYVWWSPPAQVVAHDMRKLISQILELGTWDDANWLIEQLGRQPFIEVLAAPPPGLTKKSRSLWRLRFGLPDEGAFPAARRFA